MPILILIGLAASLAMDAFAVAITSGIILEKVSYRQYFRLSFHFGLFQALMPVIGWMAGKTIADYIGAWDHWVAFILLVAIGGKMFRESGRQPESKVKNDPTRGFQLVVLSVATSIDALAIGLSLAMLGVQIITPALIIGIITMLLTLLGMKIGQKIGPFFGNWMERIGGLILILIGLRILIRNL